jgi:hypothetical protein
VNSTSHHAVSHLAAWHRRLIYTAGAVLFLTGALWLALHYTVGAGAGELPHPLEAWALRVHGLAAYAGVFAYGVVSAVHLPHGWRASRRHRWAHQRTTGLLLCALALIVGFSGYLLYYFAPEWLRPSLGWGHAIAGGALALGIALHRRGTPLREVAALRRPAEGRPGPR